ncbi:hypothetical protein L7F22_022384 [Adiantum nelumboides]|nr:hypothetical protein [Adiantum nelumboides]
MSISSKISKWVLELQEYECTFIVEDSTGASLADFLTYKVKEKKITPTSQGKLDPSPQGELEDAYTLLFDGAYHRQRNKAIGGFVILNEEKKEVLKKGIQLHLAHSNNEAEYATLKAGLEECKGMGIKRLMENGDALLIVKLVQGIWTCKNSKLLQWLHEVKLLMEDFEAIQIQHISCQHNKEADTLAIFQFEVMVGAIRFKEPLFQGQKTMEDILYFLEIGECPKHLEKVQQHRLVRKALNYQLIGDYLYHKSKDLVLKRVPLVQEIEKILMSFHDGVCGGHFAQEITSRKILQEREKEFGGNGRLGGVEMVCSAKERVCGERVQGFLAFVEQGGGFDDVSSDREVLRLTSMKPFFALNSVSLQEEPDVKLDVQFERLLNAIDGVSKQLQIAFEGLHERVDYLQVCLADNYNLAWKKMKDHLNQVGALDNCLRVRGIRLGKFADNYNLGWKKMKDHLDQVGTPDIGLRMRGTRLGRSANRLNLLEEAIEVTREDIKLLTRLLIVEKDVDLMLRRDFQDRQAMDHRVASHLFRTSNILAQTQSEREKECACNGGLGGGEMVVFRRPRATAKYDKTTMDSLDCLLEEHFEPIVQFIIFPGFKIEGSIVAKAQVYLQSKHCAVSLGCEPYNLRWKKIKDHLDHAGMPDNCLTMRGTWLGRSVDDYLRWKKMKDHLDQGGTPDNGLRMRDTRLGRSVDNLNLLKEGTEVAREDIKFLAQLLINEKDADLMLERDFQDSQAMDHCVASHLFRTLNILTRTQSRLIFASEDSDEAYFKRFCKKAQKRLEAMADWEKEKWFVQLKNEFVNACKGVWHLQSMVVVLMMSRQTPEQEIQIESDEDEEDEDKEDEHEEEKDEEDEDDDDDDDDGFPGTGPAPTEGASP